MVSEVPLPLVKEVNMEAEKPKKKSHGKVSRKIHKAEREKLKREHLNDLFLELGNVLDLSRQNNGKACILGDTTRLLQDLLAQVECLKRENAALLSESHYVTVEKNELKDENSVLEGEIKMLQTKLPERIRSEPVWNAAPPQLQHHQSGSQLPEDNLAVPVVDPVFQSPPVVGHPVFVIPLHPDLHAFQEPETAQARPPTNVTKPHARYPTPSDSWPSQLLANQPRTTQETQLSNSNSTSTSSREQTSLSLSAS